MIEQLKRKNNCGLVVYDADSSNSVPVLRKDGSICYMFWGGFVFRKDVIYKRNAIPVKLIFDFIGEGFTSLPIMKQQLDPGEYIQGAVIGNKAFVVLDKSVRIVKSGKQPAPTYEASTPQSHQ